NAITIKKEKEVLLDTYFNAFSIGKWKKYTVVDDVALQINVSGECEIQAYHCVGTADRKGIKIGV
ncbi:MAG: hypothetical protein K5675_10055, partial [Lachnospiraceae bacterium]|nr:hypothetical protein [Lachnospiraceae bacterium]